jgi:hypothetical protein
MKSRALALVLSVAVLAGCGSSSGVSASTYVRAVCNAIYPFEHNVVVRESELALSLSAIKTPAEGKSVLQAYITGVAKDTDAAIAKLESAGSPDVKGGKQISTAIVQAFTRVGSAMHAALRQANALPTTNQAAFTQGVHGLVASLSSIRGISQQLQSSPLKSPALVKAAGQEPACKNLSGLR